MTAGETGATGVALGDTVILSDIPGISEGLTGVLGVPAGIGPWPAVVVVHEAFGVTPEMRQQVRRLAEAGYLALMPDLYAQGGARRCLTATFRSLMTGKGRAYRDIEAARQTLLRRDDCTAAVGIIGFCMGGGFALMTATRGFDAASANYGMLSAHMETTLAGACPIIGTYGADDVMLCGAAKKLDTALDRVGVVHDVTAYPGAGHAFLNDPAVMTRPVSPLMKVLGIGPNPAQAAVAWTRIDAFFALHLR